MMMILLMAVIAPATLDAKTVTITLSAIGPMEVVIVAVTVRFRKSYRFS